MIARVKADEHLIVVLHQKRSDTLAEELDRLRKSHPEVDDFLKVKDHATMKETVKNHEELLAEGRFDY